MRYLCVLCFEYEYFIWKSFTYLWQGMLKSVLQYPSHPRMDVFKSLINANVETFEKCCIDIDII